MSTIAVTAEAQEHENKTQLVCCCSVEMAKRTKKAVIVSKYGTKCCQRQQSYFLELRSRPMFQNCREGSVECICGTEWNLDKSVLC